MLIIGKGLAGLIAAAILGKKVSCIHEKQTSLPNNHASLLRFRTSIVGDTVNIPFKKVNVIKSVIPYRNNIVSDSLNYAKKVTGEYSSNRSISSLEGVVQRYIAPMNFISQLSEIISCDTEYGSSFNFNNNKEISVISTIPMPLMMDIFEWSPKPVFNYKKGWTINVKIKNCDAYVTIYQPDPVVEWYRASITGNNLIIECTGDIDENRVKDIVYNACNQIGISFIDDLMEETISFKYQPYMKIIPIDDEIRKRFIMWLTDNHNVYSLGRFATWRPGLQLDDIVNDVRVIQKIINRSNYDYKR